MEPIREADVQTQPGKRLAEKTEKRGSKRPWMIAVIIAAVLVAAYLALCRELKKRTDEDLQNNVIARFHDESQLNRLVAETPGKFRILPPDYCTPEETPTGHEAILVLQKSRCINVESVKGAAKPQNFIQRKWEAFRLNWLPYLWLARDTLLRRRIDFKNDL